MADENSIKFAYISVRANEK